MKLISKLALASASVIALSAPAYGQSTERPPEDNNVPGAQANEAFSETDIIVTARRRDESSQDVPLVVNAVTAEELAKLNIREFQEITSAVPGLALSTSANGIGTQATLRGIAYDVNVSGNNGTIEFYMNDAPTSSAIVFQTMFDVGQIELLRGPQGTLRGRASPSGSMTITTRRPDLEEVGGYVNMTGTTRHTINANAAIGVPIIKDVLGVRVAGVYEESDGNQVHAVSTLTGERDKVNPYVKTKGLRVSLRFEPTDNIAINASYLKSVRDALQWAQVESANIANPSAGTSPVFVQASDRLGVGAIPGRFRQDFDVFDWQAEWRFAGQRLVYVGSHNTQHYTASAPNDPGAFFLNNPITTYGAVTLVGIPVSPFAVPVAINPTTATIPAFSSLAQSTDTRSTQDTHELRIQSDDRVFGIFDYVLGGLLLKTNSPTQLLSQAALVNFPGAGVPSTIGGVAPLTPTLILNAPVSRPAATEEKSVFFNLTAHLGDRTEVSGGLRYIHYTETAALILTDPFTGVQTRVAAAERPAPGEEPENNVIWSASLKHRFSDGFMAYFSFGTSWRPGSTTNSIIAATNSAGPVIAAPFSNYFVVPAEKSQSYEIGFKSNLFDRRLKFNATAYLQNFQNYAYQAPNIIAATGTGTSDPTSVVTTLSPGISAGVPVQVKGIEAELAWNTPRFSASASISYSKSKIQNGLIPCNDFFPADGIPDSSGQVPTSSAQLGSLTGGGVIAECRVSYSASRLAPFSATLQAEYNTPISGNVDGYLRGLASIYGDSENDPANAIDSVPAYALVNLYAGIRDPRGAWDVGFYVKNLFDTERVLSRNANPYSVSYTNITNAFIGQPRGVTGVSTYRGITMTPPREFGLNVRYAFGSR